MARPSKGRTSPQKAHRRPPKARRKVSTQMRRRPKLGDLQKQLDRCVNELTKAREQQTATAEVLQVISSSPGDLQQVFEAILNRALHVCEAAFGIVTTYDGERFEFAAHRGVPSALVERFRAGMDQPRPGDAHWRLRDGEGLIHYLDQKDEDAYRAGNPLRRAVVDLGGVRSALVVALRKNGSLRIRVDTHRHRFNHLLAAEPFTEQPNIVPEDDVAVLAPTGGTTASPKAVQLSHRNMMANAMPSKGKGKKGKLSERVAQPRSPSERDSDRNLTGSLPPAPACGSNTTPCSP